jgi:hypothetical protein
MNQHSAIGRSCFEANAWKHLTHAVILKKNYRATDPAFQELVSRARERKCNESDLHVLKQRVIGTAIINKDEWKDAPFIVPLKKDCQKINRLAVRQYCRENGKTLHILKASDQIKTVELAVGSKVMLTVNQNPLAQFGLANGCKGTVVGIVPASSEHAMQEYYIDGIRMIVHREPPVVLFKPDELSDDLKKIRFPGLEEGAYPISPCSDSIRTR